MPATRSPQAPGAAPDRMVGRVLGDRYRVLSRIGEGGMGTVYLCEHAVLRRRFAVKVLRPDLAGDGELVDRFRNEAIAASRIGQENVVDVLDFGAEEDGAFYYVMEALEGRSLGAIIAEGGPLAVPRALTLLEQICRALAAAHARGVVHRDVKPDNVFIVELDESGAERAKVIDFGISHVPPPGGAERITRAGSIIGTPEYMAPEQATGTGVDRRSDVYAVGVLAFEMLTGQLPILAHSPVATLLAHQTKVPDPPSRLRKGIPPEVDALVLRALAKRPEDRFESMDALAAEVARIRVAGDAPAAAPRPRSPRPGAAIRPSGPRGETLALPEARSSSTRTDPALARARRLRRLAVVLAVIAASGFAVASAWRSRAAHASVAARRAPGPAPSALAPPAQEPPAPGLPQPPAAGLAAGPAPATPQKAASSRPRAAPPDGRLKDPYREAAPLKTDPFE